METALVIGGWVASAAIKKLVDVASSNAMKQWARRTGLEDDVSQLHITLLRVKTLLDMAEKKEVEEGGPLSDLLQVLKDVADDAGDLLGEFEYENVREKVEETKTPLHASNLCCFPAFRRSINFFNAGEAASKVREIQKRLDMVVDGANSIIPALPQSDVTARRLEIVERETSSFFNLSDQFVGREEEFTKIIDLLLNPSNESGSSTDMKNPGVIPIVGMGGVGKTTLARYIYNYNSIQQHFELIMWVCVSENFDVKRLTKEIIEAACKDRPNVKNLNELQLLLKQKIQGKRFLLVLDDVWSDDHAKWETLCAPLAFASQGSKILTTTRLEQVASMMCTMETPIHLEGLADDAYWAFFKSCAFGSSNFEGYPKLVPIGMTIAKRLSGNPLAAKTLGSLLSRKLDETYWKSIMNSKIWEIRQDQNDIMRVLRLSYEHLPGHLKQCFAYCSLFRKDHRFYKVDLVQMWMAQGFISEDSSKQPEDVGSQYFQELVMRSFFQKCSWPAEGFEVHDLLHNLAQYVSSKECHRIENGNLESISGKIRHLSVHAKLWEMGTFKDLCKFQKLRTLVLQDIVKLDSYSLTEALHEVFTELTSIRVLILMRCGLTELPESIGKLKHLRYLDISWNRGAFMLPKSLCRLYNLRVLKMRGCLIKYVPGGISNLIYLRHLYAECYVISKIAGIGKLSSLQTLSSYTVKKENRHKITELRDLKELRGSLDIRNLENVENKKEATGANLKGKMHVDELGLSWWSSDNTNRDINTDEEVLEGLEPHPNIKSLRIDGYRGLRTPSWINIQHLSNLESIRLEKCRFWGCLPLLGQLPSLKSLSFVTCPAIKKIGDEFHYNGDIKGFSLLETLEFVGMQGWEEWSGGGEGNQLLFPVLREVTIQECPNLRHISIHLPLSLTSLHIQDCEELMYMPIERLKHLVSLKRLELSGCPKLGSSMTMVAQHQVDEEEDHVDDNNIQQLLPSSLTHLQISSCGYFSSSRVVPRCLRNLTCLQSLEIDKCPHITSLPKEAMSRLTALEYLYIYDCQDLMTLEGLQALPSLQKLSIRKCPKLLPLAAASRPEGGDDQQYAFPSLSDLEVDGTSLLTLQPLRGSLPSLRDLCTQNSLQSTMFTAGAEEQEDSLLLQNLTSLQRLEFYDCSSGFVPRCLRNLTSLQDLMIIRCPHITSFPKEVMSRLTALEDLYISGCQDLMTLEGLQALPSLEKLSIKKYPKLLPLAAASRPEGGDDQQYAFPSLSDLDVEDTSLLTLLLLRGSLPSLRFLNIVDSLQSTMFTAGAEEQEDSLLLQNLTSLLDLQFSNCHNLQSLPPELHTLSSLQSLVIYHCSEIQSLPEKGLPASLAYLRMYRCHPVLKERCQKVTGADWSKIAHINDVKIS